ncbi:MAG: hypothetical protein AAFU71_03810 [Cyanobacteria bacterium J06632_22]
MQAHKRILGVGALVLALTACIGAPSEPITNAPSPDSATVDTPSDTTSDTASEDITIVTHPTDTDTEARVTAASFSGEPGAYQVAVTLSSPDTGCEQYADWWEVLSTDGDLLYRRILAHSHVEEQPFTRSGGPVAIAPNDLIFIRVHMNNTGYSSQVLQGTVANGLRTTTLLIDPEADAALAAQSPQPSGCAF